MISMDCRLDLVLGYCHSSLVGQQSTYLARALAIGSCLILFSSCKTLQLGKKSEEKKAAEAGATREADAMSGPMKIPVGNVHGDGGFVLIRSSRAASVDPGTNIYSYGPGGMQTATLQVSAARKSSFLTADIVSGNPMRGDNVVMDFTLRKKAPEGPNMVPGGDSDIQVLE